MSNITSQAPEIEHAIEVRDLYFDYGGPSIIDHLDLTLDAGHRCILVGANGAGKTTLLRILAGKRMLHNNHVKVLGKDAFIEAPQGVTYLGTEWANNPVVKSDLTVDYLLKSMGSHRWPERTQELLTVLDVKTTWRLHQISDGQRRRVQLVMGLLHPWKLLLLDEVTVDLDVLARADFLAFLKKETEDRGCTIVYATHIFDGLGDWPTHIAHVADGRVLALHNVKDDVWPELDAIKAEHREKGLLDSPLTSLCLGWLREDRERLRNRKKLDPATGQPHTKWDDLSEDMKKNGDKFYNYWKEKQ
ncbi:P-loop containing nucleoside triphosphate hydrolase protein [Mycotypha africana]|uniref:P-loop containing nucleoside triphosphate hydrolase protein n=1 Tax=Mycotypha africana TaxID=64632 RepID=UPI0023002216|nr:P-loop containing nucleoside triphosphate hydrolase protein [Mycotypha africana]KAI8981670.1 P-loop containing nucleoside triphosphate hydrolase protein [Mycotypha africana]